jgi:hypothetical protein
VDRGRRRHGLWRRWTAVEWATIIGTIMTVIGLVVAVAAWQLPTSPDSSGTDDRAGAPGSTPAAPPPATATAARPGKPVGGAAEFLDTGFPAESGGANLVPLPRAIRADATYQPHAIGITCPSNQTGDQDHAVTFLLRGRYVQFDAAVHPYYPPGADARSATYVTVQTGVRESDGELRITEAGSQKTAAVDSPQPLTAMIDNAEKITLTVRCADPNGTVVLTDARLTGG